MLDKIHFALVQTSHPGNIGATARALKNMGLQSLILVSPKHFPHPEAADRAAHAVDILETAQVVGTLEEALSGATLVLATSARPRGIAAPVMAPREALVHVREHMERVSDPKVVFVMGPERTGLYNEDMDKAQIHIAIPTNPDYPSINLAQAVQLLSYECFLAFGQAPVVQEVHPFEQLAPFDMVDRFHEHLDATLEQLRFIKPTNPALIKSRLRKLFAKASLTQREVAILHGILSAIDGLCNSTQSANLAVEPIDAE